MLWLMTTLFALAAENTNDLLWLALYVALAAGMNDRLGALLAACLTLALMLL